MNKLPVELKHTVISFLPILSDEMKRINAIIKNYKYYFINALFCEYNKYYDEDSFFLYIEMCLLEWSNSINIFRRIVPNMTTNMNINKYWLSLFKNEWNYTECKLLIGIIFKECTLLETQQLYLFITHSLSSFSMSSSNTSISSSIYV